MRTSVKTEIITVDNLAVAAGDSREYGLVSVVYRGLRLR
jgi:hypothetical protein